MTPKLRGRPSRCVEGRAAHRIAVRVTDAEYTVVQRLAAANGCSVADVLRLGAAQLAADAGDDLLPLVLSDGRLVVFVR